MSETEGPGPAREAAERSAAAVARGDLVQVMADLTPESLAKLMALAAQPGAGTLSPANLPSISGYSVEAVGTTEAGEVFAATFTSPAGTATLEATWAVVLGQWKIVDLRVVNVEQTPES